jgi:hypothetical protein
MKYHVIIFSLLLLLTACTNQPDEQKLKEESGSSVPDVELLNGLTLPPGLKEADSMQVIYYDDPDGDTLRYTRYFTYVNSSDTAELNPLKQSLNAPPTPEDRLRNCRSGGKIYFYKGEEVAKTVYFSTRCDICCHLYYIHNGHFYYFNIEEGAKGKLKEMRGRAKKP